MKLLLPAFIMAGVAGSLVLQDREKPVSDVERTRFLFAAVHEGLIEDGPGEQALKPIVERRNEWFVPKCPICDAVYSAFRAYTAFAHDHGWKTDRKDGLPSWFGPGFSKEVSEGLAHADLKTRHGVLQKLVERYVSRHFDRIRMTDTQKSLMQEAMKLGMKEGLEMLKATKSEEFFPGSCPSCEGAN